jgi:hypothetical protein
MAAGTFLALWLAAVWLVSSADPVRDAILGLVLRDDTAYASGFSEESFRTITRGESDQAVRDLVGAPFGESWFYPPADQPLQRAVNTSATSVHGCGAVRFEAGVVVTAVDLDACQKSGLTQARRSSMWRGCSVRRASRAGDIAGVLGMPTTGRGWCVSLNARVEMVIRRWSC